MRDVSGAVVGIRLRRRHHAHVHARGAFDGVIVYFREDRLILQAERVVAAAIESLGAQPAEVTDAGNGHGDEAIEEISGLLRWRPPGKAGPRSLFRVRRQRELRHEQQAAARLDHAAVHASCVIRKDPVGQDSFRQSGHVALAVVAVHGDEHEQAVPDLADGFAVDVDPGISDSL